MNVNIFDTTLRDGEQTPGVTFAPDEKLTIAKYLLETAKVDIVEVASARVRGNELEGVQKITDWAREAGYLDRVEVLAFLDDSASLDWVKESGAQVVNLLAKGWEYACQKQLHRSTDEHIEDLLKQIDMARSKGFRANVYLEHWSNGMQDDTHVAKMLSALEHTDIGRVMLCDTLGILNPENTMEYIARFHHNFPSLNLDFHAHNDYGLAVANSMAAAYAGATTLHTTVNGLGERTGNTSISTLVAALHDHTRYNTNVVENTLGNLSTLVESFSGIIIPRNTAVIGSNHYIQGCGVHADGDEKGLIYRNKITLDPARFGMHVDVTYDLGKQAGKASLKKALADLGMDLEPDQFTKLHTKIVDLSMRKHEITIHDLPFLVADIVGTPESQKVVLERYRGIFDYCREPAYATPPEAIVTLRIGDKLLHPIHSFGDGQYDAFMISFRKAYEQMDKRLPELIDYKLRIPPGGKTSAIVETMITWQRPDGSTFLTRGVDADQLRAAVEATIKMLNTNNFDYINGK